MDTLTLTQEQVVIARKLAQLDYSTPAALRYVRGLARRAQLGISESLLRSMTPSQLRQIGMNAWASL